MAPPTEPLNLDVEAISGICGSISIACWVVVFSPQIIENFRRSSADGLSLQFIIIWLAGDVFNILGAVLQGVLPTMVILAIYYTIADVVLMGQCFYYKGFTWRDEVVPPKPKRRSRQDTENGRRRNRNGNGNGNDNGNGTVPNEQTGLLGHSGRERERENQRRGSDWSTDLTHLNPVVPIVEPSAPPPPPATTLQSVSWNALAVVMVVAAGVAGWALSRGYSSGNGHAGPGATGDGDVDDNDNDNDNDNGNVHFDLWGQIFGYLCAVLYLGSRVPQLLLNWRRKSTEGISMLFFLFACLGNLTYVLSIFAFDPRCSTDERGCEPGEEGRVYGQYILVNLSWLVGSLGTLLLDMGIFVQFFMYNRGSDEEEDDSAIGEGEGEGEDEERSIDGDRWDQRPLLERNQSEWSA